MRTYPSGSITARPIFRLECLFELGLADAAGAAGVDGANRFDIFCCGDAPVLAPETA